MPSSWVQELGNYSLPTSMNNMSRRIKISGDSWTIVQATPEEMAGTEGEEDQLWKGACHRDCRKVEVRNDLKGHDRDSVELHEVCGHALLESSGIRAWFASVTRTSGDNLERLEESFISLYTPQLHQTLLALGWTPPVRK